MTDQQVKPSGSTWADNPKDLNVRAIAALVGAVLLFVGVLTLEMIFHP